MKYKGLLNKPVVRKHLGLLATDEQRAEAANRQFHELVAKLPLLAEAHGVAAGDWFGLAFELARAHVPGFKVIDPAGRPTEWGDIDKAKLKVDVDELIAAHNGMPVTEALRRVRKLDRWTEKTKDMKETALSKHYYGADVRWVKMLMDAKAWDSIVGND